MKIGYFEHWSRPPYAFVTFLKEQGWDVCKIDYSEPRYLEGFDVVLIEQNGFNDYIENDESYFQDYIRRGGICLFQHQDYRRWAPYFIPYELGYTQLIHRHIATIDSPNGAGAYHCYMMPTVEEAGRRLFSEPNRITPDEMIYWRIRTGSFGLVRAEWRKTETVQTAALSCFLPSDSWEVLGSYMDAAVKDGALILQANYGKGLYFLNQILFPEELDGESGRILEFWKRYTENLFAHFERFRKNDTAPGRIPEASLAEKRIYRMAIHMHSLDWYGCDSSLGTINAVMRYHNVDLCSIAVKDAAPYGGTLDLNRYSDDKVLFLHGQEYHPFNWRDSNHKSGHNTYHILAIGMDASSYTTEFTKSLFSDEEIDAYLRKALKSIHAGGGVACATHPWCDYWHNYEFDAVDMEPLRSAADGGVERYWREGGRITMMNSVDFFGSRRMLDNPAVNFLYLNGRPDRESVTEAVKRGHCIAAAHFSAVDITLGEALPGDALPAARAQGEILRISAKGDGCCLKEIRLYSGNGLIGSYSAASQEIEMQIPLEGLSLKTFVRVEISGETPEQIAVSTPFYLEN